MVQEGPDMSRLRSLIQREKLRHLSSVEEDPHNTLAVMLLYSFLYGDRSEPCLPAQLCSSALPPLLMRVQPALPPAHHLLSLPAVQRRS